MPEHSEPLPPLSQSVPLALPRLGEYQLLEKLGQGATGIVYRALHVEMERVVALKILTTHRLDDERAAARFKQEMVAVGRLDHPHLVRAYDAREIDGARVLVMEYLAGLALDHLAARLGPLPVAEACELARQVAEGLQYAHEHGLVHRDIKPSNLLLVRNDQAAPTVKILDLGLARIGEALTVGDEMTVPGFILGTPDYLAPEQIADSHDVDIRADLYSLGCTLFHLLVGHPPFAGTSPRSVSATITAHSTQRPRSISEFRPDVPAGLADVVARLLAKTPIQRYRTPQEASRELARFCANADLARLLAAAESPAAGERQTRTGTDGAPTVLPQRPDNNANQPPTTAPPSTRGLPPRVKPTRLLPQRPQGRPPAKTARKPLHPWTLIGGLLTLLTLGAAIYALVANPGSHRDGLVAREPAIASRVPAASRPPAVARASNLEAASLGPTNSAPKLRNRPWILLSWTADANEKPDLWLFSTNGMIRLRVTHTADCFETQPCFSPDGRRVLFVRSDTPGTGSSLWICHLNGSSQRRLVASEFPGDRLTSPLWSSDSEIYFTWLRRPPHAVRLELWRMATDDEEPTFVFDFSRTWRLKNAALTDLSIRDRQFLIVGTAGLEPSGTDVFLAPWDGTALHRIGKPDGQAYYARGAIQSADGRQIAWRYDVAMPSGGERAQSGIAWAKRQSDGDWTVERQSFPDALVAPLAWSADGRDLLCVRGSPSGPARSRATFFLTREQFQDVRDLFGLPHVYLPADGNSGRLADWSTLPFDVPLPEPSNRQAERLSHD